MDTKSDPIGKITEAIMARLRGSVKDGVNHQNKPHYNVIWEAFYAEAEKHLYRIAEIWADRTRDAARIKELVEVDSRKLVRIKQLEAANEALKIEKFTVDSVVWVKNNEQTCLRVHRIQQTSTGLRIEVSMPESDDE